MARRKAKSATDIASGQASQISGSSLASYHGPTTPLPPAAGLAIIEYAVTDQAVDKAERLFAKRLPLRVCQCFNVRFARSRPARSTSNH